MTDCSLTPSDLLALQKALGIRSDGSHLVETRIDGTTYLAHLITDDDQLEHRVAFAIGAVTSTAALHALWSLPLAAATVADLSEIDVETIGDLPPGLVEVIDGDLVARRYQPIGDVRLLATVSRSLRGGLRRAVAIPPIFERVCVWRTDSAQVAPTTESVAMARRSGTGIIRLAGAEAEVVVEPRKRVVGVPAVYRWWVAELAYGSRLRQAQSAQAVS